VEPIPTTAKKCGRRLYSFSIDAGLEKIVLREYTYFLASPPPPPPSLSMFIPHSYILYCKESGFYARNNDYEINTLES
jgi:hypothetical protein